MRYYRVVRGVTLAGIRKAPGDVVLLPSVLPKSLEGFVEPLSGRPVGYADTMLRPEEDRPQGTSERSRA